MTRLLLTCDTVGGVWQYATDLASALPALGFEPVLATLGPPPSTEQRRALGGALQIVPTDLPLDWLARSPRDVSDAGVALARLADRQRAELVHVNAPALAAGVRFSQPVVAVAHSCVGTWWQAVKGGAIDPDLAWRAELTAAGLAAADRVVAPSAAFAAALSRCYRLAAPPIVVHNGRRPFVGRAVGEAAFAFTAGRLWDEAKNLRALDAAAAGLALPIRAAGPVQGPNAAAIALPHLHLLGSLGGAAMAAQLAARPIYVSPAVYEPFGLAVLEAAQAGCPLVLSDIPTFRELWDGVARFVDPHGHAGLARAIQDIAADPALRTRLGAAAQARACVYTVDRMAAAMAAIYHAMLPDTAPNRVAA